MKYKKRSVLDIMNEIAEISGCIWYYDLRTGKTVIKYKEDKK